MGKSNLDWGSSCLFVVADIGDVDLFDYWANKGLNIDIQDEDGDTPLHYAARRGHIDLVNELLKRGALIRSNKKKRTALQDAYAFNQLEVAKEITKSITQKNSVKNILQFQKSTRTVNQEKNNSDQFVNDFIRYLQKNYLDRNIFVRFPAKHNRRANALIIAARRCNSIKEFKNLIVNNQLNLFKGVPASPISKSVIDKRWSEVIKNKPLNVNKSQFYKTINNFVIERFSTMDMAYKNYTKRA